MNCSKPVSYLTLKCLIKHLDAGLRIQLSTIYPSIHNLEKSIPLDIKNLEITDDHIKVDRSTFQFSIYNGNSNRFILELNENERLELSGVEQDPLRIDIRRVPEMEGIATLESAIDSLKLKLSTQTTKNEYEDSRFLARLEAKLDRFYKKLYYNPPGVKYIQLKIGGHVEVLCNQRKTHEAMEYLLGKLFGGKVVNVNTLAFGWKTSFQAPSSVKLRVANLDLHFELTYKAMDIVELLIEESCLPLNSVESWIKHNVTLVNIHPIVHDARILKLKCVGSSCIIRRLKLLLHKRIHLTSFSNWDISFLLKIVDDWVSGSVGEVPFHTIRMSEETIDNVMECVRAKYEDRVDARFIQNANEITLNLNATSNLVISKSQEETSWILGLKIEHRRLQ